MFVRYDFVDRVFAAEETIHEITLTRTRPLARNQTFLKFVGHHLIAHSMTLSGDETTRPRAFDIVKRGGVIAFRTDTFYGLGADPFNLLAVERIKELKGREDDKPILLLISNLRQLPRLLKVRSNAFEVLAKDLWPGPLTIIGLAVDNLPEEITAGTGTVGVRLPDDEQVRMVVEICGGVLTATSANPSGASPGESAKQVRDYFAGGIDLIIDGGPVEATQPSTVVDASSDEVKIIREGAVSRGAIKAVLGKAGLQLSTPPF